MDPCRDGDGAVVQGGDADGGKCAFVMVSLGCRLIFKLDCPFQVQLYMIVHWPTHQLLHQTNEQANHTLFVFRCCHYLNASSRLVETVPDLLDELALFRQLALS